MSDYRTATFELRNAEVSPETVLQSLQPILDADRAVVWQGNLVAPIAARPKVEEEYFTEICETHPGISRVTRYDHNDTVSRSWATLYKFKDSLETVEKVKQGDREHDRWEYEDSSDEETRLVDWIDIEELRKEHYSEILHRMSTPEVMEIDSFGGNDWLYFHYGNPTQDEVTTYLQIKYGFHTIACSAGHIGSTEWQDPWEWEWKIMGSGE